MKKISLLLVILLALGGVSALAEGQTPEIQPESDETFFTFGTEAAGEDKPEIAAEPAEKVWTYPIAREILDDPTDVIRLINRDNLLDKDYPPQDGDAMYKLINTTVKKTKNEEMMVREVVNDALEAMFAAANAEDVNPLVHSAYRSYRTQEVMHANRLERIGKDDGVVQYPGASEHQSGLCADVINTAWAKEDRLSSGFYDTKEGKWLEANCAKYGFIIRYPKDKEDITGIIYEPWHLRYVGVEVATYMMENGLTLEEFTSEWRAALAEYELQMDGEGPVVDSFSF